MQSNLLNHFTNSKLHFYFLGAAWLLLQVFLFWYFGIFTELEAAKYISQAHILLHTGAYESGNFLFYSTEILLIAASLKLNIGFWLLAVFQTFMNGLSIFLFYQMVQQLTSNKFVAITATIVFLCNFYYQLYNVYLYTESLFFSFSVVYAYLLFQQRTFNLSLSVLTVLLLTLLVFTRPTGILFLPPTIFFYIFRFGKKKAPVLFVLTCAGGLFLFYFLLNKVLNSGGELNFLLPYLEEQVICGVPAITQPHQISMPVNQNSVEGLWYIISHNSQLFIRLAAKRFVVFWGVQRPFYSAFHNTFLAVYFYGMYAFILAGLKKMLTYQRPESAFLLTYILLVMLTVLLSCDEWHSRFLYSLLPFLLLLASGAFVKKSKGREVA